MGFCELGGHQLICDCDPLAGDLFSQFGAQLTLDVKKLFNFYI